MTNGDTADMKASKTRRIAMLALVAIILIGAFAIAQAHTQSAQAQGEGCPWGWTVRNGETVALIAQRFGVTVAAIRAANPGVRIRPGVSITVPCPTVSKPAVLLDGNGNQPIDLCWNGRSFYRCKKQK